MDDPVTLDRFRAVADLAGLTSGFEALFQAAPSPFLVVTPPDYTIVAVNDEYLRATMTQRAAILGRGLFEVFPDNPDSPTAAGPPALRASLARVVAHRRTDDMPIVRYDIPTPAGGFEERWWSPRNAPVLGPDGEVGCIIHHVVDVTARVRAETALRKSEERMRRAISVPKVGVLFFDLAGHINDANEAFQHMSGYTLEELRTSAHWQRLTAPEFFEVTAERARDLAERGETPAYEKQMIRKDGTRWWGIFTPTRLSGSGTASECVEFIFDITEAKRAQEALRESEQRLRVAVGERDALLQEVHHRVKNNLQVITSLLEMQGRQTADRQAISSLSEARNRITAISAIHELLYQSGSFSDVDLAAYARRLVRHVASLYDRDSRIAASVEGDGITIDLARAVPFGLLLNELVSNAYKHAFRSREGGRLRVAFRREDGDIRLDVRDTGVGLPSGLDERASATLGLQLVRMLAKQLGGTVAFSSAGGTNAEVHVPLQGRPG